MRNEQFPITEIRPGTTCTVNWIWGSKRALLEDTCHLTPDEPVLIIANSGRGLVLRCGGHVYALDPATARDIQVNVAI